jgi:hygromycin-B 4-O-kinase
MLRKEEVEAFLQEHLDSEIAEVAPIGFGGWSQAFSFLHGATALVARFGNHVEDYHKDQYAMRFAGPSLPIPRVLEIGQGLDRYFCLSERAYGAMLESRERIEIAGLVPAVFRMLDALREADIGTSTGFGGWHADGNAPYETWQAYLLSVDEETERVHGWHENMARSPIDTTSYNTALAYLKSHIHHCPDARHLLHTDLLHFNVLVGDNTINAVVDWGNARYGDFLYELAAFTFYAPWYPAMQEIDWREVAQKHYQTIGCDVPNFDERHRCCEVHIGLDGMAYNAFTQRWDHFMDTAKRTLALIG